MSAVHFPNREAVLNEIDILKHVQKVKKNAFMNACNTNKLVCQEGTRQTYIDDPKV